ncbi:MAG: ComEC/Rec2 family competence protein [Raineya sp.]
MAGILSGNFVSWYNEVLPIIWLGLVILYWSLFFFVPRKKKVYFSPIQGGLLLFIIAFLGYLVVHFRNESRLPYHILQNKQHFDYYRARVVSEVQEKLKTYQFVCAIEQIQVESKWYKSRDKVNIFLQKDSSKFKPRFGDVFVAPNKLQLINEPLNAYQFNYRKFLAYKNIYHQQYIQYKEFGYVGNQTAWYEQIEALAIEIRQYCDKALAKYIASEQEHSIAAALVLGIKHHLDEDLKQAYTNAGVTHVLAVSGMHVGIIFALLNLLLNPLRKQRNAKVVYLLIVLSVLWLYAFITGLSGSVSRAVTMFSLITIASNIGRNTNIYNTLASSAFLLLLWNPFLLMDVGFQLSYLAVISIVYLYPKLYPLYEAPNRIVDFLWQMTCVSVAAQVFTLPITLYHFHQYPTYGILASILIVPLGQIILTLGVAVLGFSFIPFVAQYLGWALQKIIWLSNKVVFGIENLDYATTSLVLDAPKAIALSGFLLFLIWFFEYKKFVYLILAVSCYAFLSVSFIWQSHHQSKQKVLVIYGIPNAWACSLTEGFRSQIWADSSLQKQIGRLNFNTKNLLDELGTKQKNYNSPPNWQDFGKWKFWVWQGENFVFIQKRLNSKDWQAINNLENAYLIIQNNAVRKLEKITKKPKLLIIDASNKTYIAAKLSKEAIERDFDTYNILEKGSFILKK